MLSKLDGDARGGAALSVRAITGKPVKFAGVGEKLEDIEPFHPDRMASRILGMGDVLASSRRQKRLTMPRKAGKWRKSSKEPLHTEDFLRPDGADEIHGLLRTFLPGCPGQWARGRQADGRKAMAHTEAIILSMTPKEREKPEIIGASRKKRIAAGAGLKVEDVNRLLKSFEHDPAAHQVDEARRFRGKMAHGPYGRLGAAMEK